MAREEEVLPRPPKAAVGRQPHRQEQREVANDDTQGRHASSSSGSAGHATTVTPAQTQAATTEKTAW